MPYAQAIIGTVDALTGASVDAAYEAAYGKFYTQYQRMHNAANAKVAAEANINAIRQDKVNTDTFIRQQQDKVEAEIRVAAAVSGATGGSVEDTINQTEIASSFAIRNNAKKLDQQVENQLSNIHTAQSTLLQLDSTSPVADINPLLETAKSLSTISSSQWGEIMEQAGEYKQQFFGPAETVADGGISIAE